MHLRRAVLLFALILGLTALATAVAPVPPPPAETTVPIPPPKRPAPTVAITFAAPAQGRPPVKTVAPGAHVVLAVQSEGGGQASIPALGRTASVSPGTPARFDVVVPSAGRYDVLFAPALGSPARVGTLVSRR